MAPVIMQNEFQRLFKHFEHGGVFRRPIQGMLALKCHIFVVLPK